MASRKQVLRRSVLAAAVVAGVVAVAAQPQSQAPDLIVTNAAIVTMDEQRPRATALAVRDGRFVAVGAAAEIAKMRADKTRVIDAAARP